MLAIPTLLDFLRSPPRELLRQYFSGIGVAPPPAIWGDTAAVSAQSLLRAVDALDDAARTRIGNDADRVCAMADGPGQSALFAVSGDGDALERLPNGHATALWMLLCAPGDFEHAEQVRYADDRRFGRMWDGFVCRPGCNVAREGAALDAFKQAVGARFGSRNVEVEVCERCRPRLGRADAALVQATIYREGRAGERKAFVNGRLDRLQDHPVIEAAITYGPADGTVEVVATVREAREDLVRLFAEHMLGAPFRGERLPVRHYTLERLRSPYGFPTDPGDNIEEVKVALLRLMPYDTRGERVTLECMRGASRNIWQMADTRFGEQDPLQDGYAVTKATLIVRFRAVPGAHGRRTLPINITVPSGCDLKDRTEQERLVGEKYLNRWGLVRHV